MKHKIFLFLFSLALIFSFGSIEQVFACSCRINVPACQRYAYSDAIFIGKAVDVIKEERQTGADGRITGMEKESTVFEVEESLLGTKKKQITVRNRTGFSCDVSFEQGETYLIFANGNKKEGFGTSFCSGNTLISDARELLDELRNLPKTGTGGKLFGQATESLKKRDEKRIPMPGVKIKVQEVGGKQKIYNAVTDKEGNYELIVPQGKYKLIPAIPAYADFDYIKEEPFSVKDRGCVEESFSLRNKSQISGRLIDADGKPVSKGNSLFGIRLELISADLTEKPGYGQDEGWASINEDGTFTINNIPVGKYTLSVNYTTSPSADSPYPTTFYPNTSKRENAAIIEVGLGQTINNLIFRLPPRIKKQKVSGTILLPDGRPAAGVTINLNTNDSDRSFSYTQTDENGNFELIGFAGEKYNFSVDYYGENERMRNFTVKKSVFTLDKDTQPIRLVLEKKLEDRENLPE